jgi:hypothetical protein
MQAHLDTSRRLRLRLRLKLENFQRVAHLVTYLTFLRA